MPNGRTDLNRDLTHSTASGHEWRPVWEEGRGWAGQEVHCQVWWRLWVEEGPSPSQSVLHLQNDKTLLQLEGVRLVYVSGKLLGSVCGEPQHCSDFYF